MQHSKKADYSHLFAVIGGAAIGYAFSLSQADESKTSRAERDDPEAVKEVCEDIASLLEEWVPDDSCRSEADYTDDLAEFLETHTDWDVEVGPTSPEGHPDILIGDLLALELKVGLNKAQRDRLIGQCAGYSRLWVTWAVILEGSRSELGRLVDLLEDKGLDHIAVWDF